MDYGISDAFPGIATSTAYDTTKNSSSVSMDDFLKILSASMQNPSMSSDSSSGGSSSTDYVSQLAQLRPLIS
nr:flagellar hook capping FlgD N-terminal domain-containing protein [Liquorilactobacillus satsumensis]